MEAAYFKINQGDTESVGIVVTDESGTRQDLTTVASILLTIKIDSGRLEHLLERSVSLTDPDTDLSAGYVVLVLTSAETGSIPRGRYRFELAITYTNGTVKTVGGVVDSIATLRAR